MKKNIHQKGFTLVESLVAIGILVVSIMGAFSAAQVGISSSIYAREQTIAFNLAQEAVEQIKNMRDVNLINGQNWLQGISNVASDPCYFGRACKVDAIQNNVTPCPAPGSCPYIRQDGTTGFFGYNSGWPLTEFKREVQLTYINDHEVAVTVNVSWSKGSINNQFVVRENIFNW